MAVRFVLALLTGLLCTQAEEAFATETRDLILVAGQSNAVGFDAKPSELSPNPADNDVLFWWRTGDPPPDDYDSTSDGKWTHLQPQPKGNPRQLDQDPRQYGNFANADGGFGPEIGLARDLYGKGDKRLAIVKAAWSGTSMAQDWNASDSSNSGPCYRALVSETKAAIAAAMALGVTLHLRALVWVQGEADANPSAAPSYEKGLSDMIAALRKDLDSPKLIALLAVNTRFGGGKNPFMSTIVDAQQSVAAKDPRVMYVDTSTATTANAAHFDAAGTLDVSRRFAQALLKIEASGSE